MAVLRSVSFLTRRTLIVWGTTLKQGDLDRLENIQYRAAKLVTGALHLTSREKLNSELGWETIKTRIDYLGLCLFQKINLAETRPLVQSCMTAKNFGDKKSKQFGHYKKHPNFGVGFSKSFFPYFTNKWNSLSRSTKNHDLIDFKNELKSQLKPTKNKFYEFGSKLGNKLITRLRVGRSYLNSHSYAVGKSESPSCLCHEKQETTRHYLLHCFLYVIERQQLFDQVKEIVKKFEKLPQYKQEQILLFGLTGDDNYDTNVKIQKLVQNYILKTKRFLL